MSTAKTRRLQDRVPPIPAAEVCFETTAVARIECELCGARAFAGTLHAETETAVFASRGWRIAQNPRGQSVQVCRLCGKGLGESWTLTAPGTMEDKDA